MGYLKWLSQWHLLFHLMAHLPWSVSTSVLVTKFRLKKSPSMGPTRVEPTLNTQSKPECALLCQSQSWNCLNFMFNSNSGLCTLCSWKDDAMALPSNAEGDLYTVIGCDASKGFTLYVNGNTRSCLRWFQTELIYPDADLECRKLGGYLVSVKTLEKLELLSFLVTSSVWVGCDDRVNEGQFLWREDGEMLTVDNRLTLFEPGEPNDGTYGEDCITYKIATNKMADRECDNLHEYVCELPF